jgi:hypothetical protein
MSDKLIERYRVLQAPAPGCLLLMQVGAFMPAMNEEARAVAAVTGLKLQVGGAVDAPTVLGGFPTSGLDQSLGQLARAGHSIAVARQDADQPRRLAEVIRVRHALGVSKPLMDRRARTVRRRAGPDRPVAGAGCRAWRCRCHQSPPMSPPLLPLSLPRSILP